MKFCVSCGTENDDNATFCIKCGYNFDGKSETSTKEITANETSRTLELVLGIIGAIFGLLGGVFAIMLSSFGGTEIFALGMSALLASIVGIVGSVYVKNNAKTGGIILIISAIWLLISISAYGILGFILLGIAGLIALIRK